MSDFSLNKGFPKAEWDEWKTLVEKTLGGADFDKKLVSTTYDNIKIQPLYTHQNSQEKREEFAGTAPFTRGVTDSPQPLPWHIAQAFSQPDPGEANKNILSELKNGVTALVLRLDDDAHSERTITINNLEDVEQLLFNVHLEMLPIHLDAGDRAASAAALLLAHAQKSKAPLDKCDITLGLDPLGELARRGAISETIELSLALLSDTAQWVDENLPLGKAVSSDTRHYHAAGASQAQEIAFALATALYYLRAMEKNGVDLDKAANQICFHLTADADFFGTMAKLRAVRRLWATLTTACDIKPSPAKIIVETASRMMSERDPGVNMLRTTVACFAAGAAGASSITVEPYTTKHGMPDKQARRIARNTQIILQEEAGIAKVLDPAGGSFFIENLTDDLAKTAYDIFQTIEAKGGMFTCLKEGYIQEQISSLHDRRRLDIAKRKLPVTGVSEFPDIHEGATRTGGLSTPKTGQTASMTGPLALPAPPEGAFAAMIEAGLEGASLTELSAAFAGGGENCEALPVISLGEDYERLRTASDDYLDKTGARPKIFLCNLGRISAFTQRATFAKNFFEAGGIEAIQGSGYETVQDALGAYKESGAQIAVICSSDEIYQSLGVDTAKALSQTPIKALFLAGHPGDKKQAYEDAGINEFVYMGCDVLSLLQQAHQILGVAK